MSRPTRRSAYEVVLNPALPKAAIRYRSAVTVIHAPDAHEAADLLLELMGSEDK